MQSKIIFSDFDGTLTLGTDLTSHFFEIIQLLNENDIPLVIVTGRSQAWGHFLLTHFPLLHVVTEGGGVISRRKNLESHLIEDQFMTSLKDRNNLEKISQDLLKKFPKLTLSADSQGRKADRAIELEVLSELEIYDEVADFLKKSGANVSRSNVHLNFWTGKISKYTTTKYLLENDFKQVSLEECLYFGDSLNDESMFEKLPYTIGVSNINNVLDQLKHRPHIILDGVENAGPRGVLNYLKKQSKVKSTD